MPEIRVFCSAAQSQSLFFAFLAGRAADRVYNILIVLLRLPFERLGCAVFMSFSRPYLFFFGAIRTTVRLRLLSLRRVVWPILTHLVRIWVSLFRSACINSNMTPTFDFQVLGMGFFRATLRVCCTLHPDLPCNRHCRASTFFSTWTVLFVASTPRFHVALHRPA